MDIDDAVRSGLGEGVAHELAESRIVCSDRRYGAHCFRTVDGFGESFQGCNDNVGCFLDALHEFDRIGSR